MLDISRRATGRREQEIGAKKNQVQVTSDVTYFKRKGLLMSYIALRRSISFHYTFVVRNSGYMWLKRRGDVSKSVR